MSRLSILMLTTAIITGIATQGIAGDYDKPDATFAAPPATPNPSGGSRHDVATGNLAHGSSGAPATVCPANGAPDVGDFTNWFTLWSVQQVGGYAMHPPGPAFKILTGQDVNPGSSRTYHVGNAPVKKLAICVFAPDGDPDAEDVVVEVRRTGLSDEVCVSPAPCVGEFEPIAGPTLNTLILATHVNDVDFEYDWRVTAPDDAGVSVTIGGRLGTYPSITLATN